MHTVATLSATRSHPWKWSALSLLMRSLGRWSEGIDLGFRRGFDSGEMLDYVYENRARGRYLVGRLFDRVYLDQVGWRAIRARRALLQRALEQEIAANRHLGRPTHIVDLAAGPGRYLLAVLAAHPGADLSALCRDLDPSGLARGRALAKGLGLRRVYFEQADALDPTTLAALRPRPSVVVVSGLYELLLDDAQVQSSLRSIHALLAPGGVLLCTTQVAHPQLEAIAHLLVNRHGAPWVMGLRAVEEVDGWARQAGFAQVASAHEPLGLFAVTRCVKGED